MFHPIRHHIQQPIQHHHKRQTFICPLKNPIALFSRNFNRNSILAHFCKLLIAGCPRAERSVCVVVATFDAAGVANERQALLLLGCRNALEQWLPDRAEHLSIDRGSAQSKRVKTHIHLQDFVCRKNREDK